MCSLINKQLLLTAYAYLFITEQQKGQQGSEALEMQESGQTNLEAEQKQEPALLLGNQGDTNKAALNMQTAQEDRTAAVRIEDIAIVVKEDIKQGSSAEALAEKGEGNDYDRRTLSEDMVAFQMVQDQQSGTINFRNLPWTDEGSFFVQLETFWDVKYHRGSCRAGEVNVGAKLCKKIYDSFIKEKSAATVAFVAAENALEGGEKEPPLSNIAGGPKDLSRNDANECKENPEGACVLLQTGESWEVRWDKPQKLEHRRGSFCQTATSEAVKRNTDRYTAHSTSVKEDICGFFGC